MPLPGHNSALLLWEFVFHLPRPLSRHRLAHVAARPVPVVWVRRNGEFPLTGRGMEVPVQGLGSPDWIERPPGSTNNSRKPVGSYGSGKLVHTHWPCTRSTKIFTWGISSFTTILPLLSSVIVLGNCGGRRTRGQWFFYDELMGWIEKHINFLFS